jgi:hypothetical protein
MLRSLWVKELASKAIIECEKDLIDLLQKSQKINDIEQKANLAFAINQVSRELQKWHETYELAKEDKFPWDLPKE